jgi:tetratricopeptide (TPR) repeat protein
LQNQTVELDTLQNLYDEWFEVRLKDIDKLEEIKSKIDSIVKHIKGYIFTHPEYWLISLGHDVILENLSEAAVSLDQLEKFDISKLSTRYQFYYYLFKGTYYLFKGEHKIALSTLQIISDNPHLTPNNIERAEYYYKVGGTYYHLKKTIDSIHYLSNALTLFKSEPGYERRIMACEIALGLNSVDLHQWEEAEERFYNALNYSNKVKDNKMKATIYHDLGLLYAEQNMSKAAIHWFNESLLDTNPNHKTIYLIAREYLKVGNKDEATRWLNKGIKIAIDQNLTTYIIRFNLLKVLYFENDKKVIESTLLECLNHFMNENDWYYVQEVALRLAEFYSKQTKYKEAVKYYQLMVKAQNNILEMGALK